MVGGAKADTIYGGKGNDSIVGNEGSDKLFGDAGNDKLLGGKGNDTLTGGAGNDTLTGGAGNDVFIYTSGDGNDRITDFSATDTLQIGDGTGTYSAQTSGKNVVVTVGEGKVTLVGAANLSKVNIAGKTDTTIDGVIVKGKSITLTEDFENESFALTGKYKSAVTVDASAAIVDLNIVGNNKANKIVGGTQNDTLIGGGANDTLTGGDGADIFVHNKGDGNDIITDYAEDDSISIKGENGALPTITSSTTDVVFTLKSKSKITIDGAAEKIINYYVDGREYNYSAVNTYVKFNTKGTSATVQKKYPLTNFTPSLYSEYANMETINASAVTHDMNIVGNKKANTILGGSGDDTINGGAGADSICGGKGNDCIKGGEGNDEIHGGIGSDILIGGTGNDKLWGEDGADTFIYANGDGNDTIYGYDYREDKIVLNSGTVNPIGTDDDNGNVIFTIGTGKIVLYGGKGNYAEIVNSSGTPVSQYKG